ncbi:methyltransferase domain-containing protein [Amycolatopsis jejuensis]|uniref:methyltransferase domain-containing protein n=1 Tax=Amycolatopsis jejuensis TaxID=330084 RepID=UPI000AEC4983|nr:methyltransferase domain-containing protein [Amycolatopsis jejuensis]
MVSPAVDPLMADPAEPIRCRYCHGESGEVVLDLGQQPGCEQFPRPDDDGPDPRYPLRMWCCTGCGLAQLAEDPGLPETVLSVEPQAMRDQAERVLDRLAAEGWLHPGASAIEFGSPHGGSWLPRVLRRGLVAADGRADLVLDTYGMLHEPDQSEAMLRRAARLAPGGLLVFQLFSLGSVLRLGQWDELRHGHHGYWSLPALDEALARYGLGVHRAWNYPLAGGTLVVLANHNPKPDRETRMTIEAEYSAGVLDFATLRKLQERADADAARLRAWLTGRARTRRRVIGYGAASRAVPLLCHAGVDVSLLRAIADASPGKQGRRMPGTQIPVIPPEYLRSGQPADVLLLLPQLLDEVRRSVPEVEDRGGRWIRVDDVLAGRA